MSSWILKCFQQRLVQRQAHKTEEIKIQFGEKRNTPIEIIGNSEVLRGWEEGGLVFLGLRSVLK